MGDTSDTDSDETLIEGSVGESELEEEEMHIKRLSLMGKDMASTTDNNIATEMKDINGELSPEIQLIYKNSTCIETLKHPEQIILLHSEDEKEESQSLLHEQPDVSGKTASRVGIICPVLTTDVCQSDCPPAATVHGGNSHFISLNSEMTGLLETSQKNLLNGDDSSETCWCSGMATVEVVRDSVPRSTEMSDIFQSKVMINKEDMAENGLSPEILASDITKDRIIARRSEVEDESLNDFDTQMMSYEVNMLKYQNDVGYMNVSINEKSTDLPVELITALNSLSEPLVGSVNQGVEKGSEQSPGKKQLIPEQTDDCTQITDTHFKPKLNLEQHEETEVPMITKLPYHSEQQIDCNQHTYKLVLSDHQSIMCCGRSTEKGNFILNETRVSEQTIQVTSHAFRKSARKRRDVITDEVYATLNSLKGSLQKKQSYKAQTSLTAKNSQACESGRKDKGDRSSQPKIASPCGSLMDMNGRIVQMRKSQRIAKKSRKQTTSKNYFNDSSFTYISLSSINRRDVFGQTLLHRAVLEDDLDRIRAVIKAGANVNAQDYAGWTALHEASLAGFFEATNDLLKAGADVNCKGQEQITPLHDAVKEGHYKVAELLLWYGADPLFKHEKGKCALEEATDKRMRKLLESYITKSNRRSTSGCSDSREKRASSSQQLCAKAARINKRNSKGETCLHLAAKKGNLSLVKFLIASGACVNQKDNAGWTAIHEASFGGFVEIIAELLKAGAEVNSKSVDGALPIHDAVSGNHFEAVQFLLCHGAHPNETDNCGKNTLDEATCDKMRELLKSYGATESEKTSRRNDIAGRRELRPSHSRRPRRCYDCYGNDNLLGQSTAARQKCRTHEFINEILQEIEEKQNKLLLFELKSQRDADLYIQDLSQIQSILNEMLVTQKSERDNLAKKYRASVESFEQGALREQLAKLVSRQKSLLLMAQKQKELGQKLKNYKKAKKETSGSTKQIPSTSSSYEKNNTKGGASDKTPQCSGVAMDPESRLFMESSFLDQEHNQHPNGSLSGGNGRAIRQNTVGPYNMVSRKKLREDTVGETLDSMFSSAVDDTALPSEPAICLSWTEKSSLEETDCGSVAPQRNTSPAAIPMPCALNIFEARNPGVNNNINQPIAFVGVNETLEQHSNLNDAYQTQIVRDVESIHSCLTIPQKFISPHNKTSLNANSELTVIDSNALSPSRTSQDSSNCSNKQDAENQLNFKPNRRKKNHLLDLLEQGKIKPGDDVLEFTVQDIKYKASLLGNGKVKTGNNTVYQNPVQWIKALLGNDISVSWKYVWNKVTYCGTLLSKIITEVHIPKEPLQQKKPFEPPNQPSSSKQLRFLQFNEVVLIEDEELLPQHIMDQYWNFYIHCENFGF